MDDRIRVVIIEDEPVVAQQLATFLDETCQVEVLYTAAESETALQVCAEIQPEAAFVDTSLQGKDHYWLAGQLAQLPRPPRLIFTSGTAAHAADAFRLEAIDYLLKPLDPQLVVESVNRLRCRLRPTAEDRPATKTKLIQKLDFFSASNDLLPVKDGDRDRTRLLARREITVLLRRERRTWIHTVREEFATYYTLADVMSWLGEANFIKIARDAVVNLQAVEEVIPDCESTYRVRLRDRTSTEIRTSRVGALRLAALIESKPLSGTHPSMPEHRKAAHRRTVTNDGRPSSGVCFTFGSTVDSPS